MKCFKGFPKDNTYTAIPNIFFSEVLPFITDASELKATLFVFSVICRKKGRMRFATLSEISNFSGISNPKEYEEALDKAVKRGVLVKISVKADNTPETLYFINTENDRKLAEDIAGGNVTFPSISPISTPANVSGEKADIFTLYEENIGSLSPIIVEELKEAEKLYPKNWVNEAFKEAVSLNKRNWKYIRRILENWLNEGKKDGAHKKNYKESPDKYTKGKYGNLVNR